ncbi:MAG: response regulator [Acidobacteriota bacterium]|nr:response regulator [Acidobacteriota bacterium]
MPVRRKTLVILVVTVSALVGILYLVSRTFLLSRFTDIEREAVRQDVDRSSAALSADLDAMDELALDNSSWDAAYSYMGHPTPGFIASAFGQAPAGAFVTQHDDFLLFVSLSGAIVGDKNFGPSSGKYASVLQEMRARLAPDSPLVHGLLLTRPLHGILMLSGRPVLFAARPVLPSTGQGTSRGALVVGRFFNEGEIRRLAQQTHLKLSFLAVSDSLPSDVNLALGHLRSSGSAFVQPLDRSTIAGYALVPDIYGHPALILKTEVPRAIYQEGRLSVLHFAAALLLAGIVFGGIVQLLLEKSLVSPLAVLNASVEQIAAGVDQSNASVRSGRDELAMLGNAVHRMIDAVHRSEEQRNQIEARYRVFMNNLPAIAAIKDEAGRFVYFNAPLARTFGLDLQSFEKPIEPTWLPAHTIEQIRSHEQEVRQLLRPMEFEEIVPKPDGAEHYWLTLRFPLTEADGRILIGMVAIDITERKRAEAELSLAREKAELALRTKAEFLADVSHEIRAPINGVIGMTDLALESGPSPEQREYLEVVKSSARTLLSLFNDIIDFSKLDAGTLDFENIDFSLRGAVESIIRSLAPAARENKIELSSRIDDAVPDAIRGDPTRLRQVLVNLLQLGLKLTQFGEIVLSADAEMQTEEEIVLHFCVRMAAEGVALPNIGAQAGKSDGAHGAGPWLGRPGLSVVIAARLAELMGGRIWAETQPGHGSSYNFNARFELLSPYSDAGRPASMSQLHDRRVMVADDNPTNRKILAEMLQTWRMRPTVAAGGAETLLELERAREQGVPFSLAILDSRMPDMDGFRLAEKIRHDPRLAGTKILLLTSAGLRGDAARCRDLGIQAYLPKPVAAADLLDAIRRVLGKAASEGDGPSFLVTRHSLREARRRLKILIAEDNAVDRTLAVRLLEKRGYTVETVETGRAVLQALERDSFDAILMDIQMPELDGLQATVAIRDHERITGIHVPIIAMTAYAMSGDRERCLAAGMDRYIPKPLNVQHLYQTIDEISASTPSLV